MRALSILTVKNEAPFLLEWLAEMGWLTHVRNDGPHDQGPQWAALKAANKHPLLQAADRVLCADIDELVNIHAGDRSLTALLTALPQADAVTLTWRLFGNAGVVAFDDRPVTATFTRAAPATIGWPWRAQMFKTLFRAGHFRKLGVHRPRQPDPAKNPRRFDGSGRAINPGQRPFSDYRQDNYQMVQLNHYALRAMESYLVKCDRGRANREASAFDMGYWVECNLCAVEDRSIQTLNSSALRQDSHNDPVLGPLHKAGVAWRKARFASLMADDQWRATFGRLLICGPSRTLSLAETAILHAHSKPAAQS